MQVTMVEIRQSRPTENHLETLRVLIVKEWEEFEGFLEVKHNIPIPAPLLAINGGELIGGLAFTAHVSPGSTEARLWINALLVIPRFRLQGIASLLVEAAEVLARKRGFTELFALTEIPTLYEKLRWFASTQLESDTVMRKVLTG